MAFLLLLGCLAMLAATTQATILTKCENKNAPAETPAEAEEPNGHQNLRLPPKCGGGLGGTVGGDGDCVPVGLEC